AGGQAHRAEASMRMLWIVLLAGCDKGGTTSGTTAETGDSNPFTFPVTTSTGDERVATILALTPDQVAGQDTFETTCAICHGLDGNGIYPNPALTKRVPNLAPEQVVSTVLEGKGNMDSYKAMKNQDIANVVSYVITSFGGG